MATLREMQDPIKVSAQTIKEITGIVIAPDSKKFATMDSGCCVCLFVKDHKFQDPTLPIEWIFHGNRKTHELQITSIAFGESLDEHEEIKYRLFSIGKDRRLFEYDIKNSSEKKGLAVDSMFKIEQEATPTASVWLPKSDSLKDLLLTVNNEYKMKVWNVSTKTSRKTVLGPTYGGEIVKLKNLEIEGNPDKYLFYSTAEKVIGLIKQPLDGNPTKTMGLIAHPDHVVDICATSDGKFIFTCGGSDLAINMWMVDVTPIENAIQMGVEGIEPFINLIEGGREGQTY